MTQEDFFSGSVSLGQNHGGLNTSSSLIYNRAGNFCKSSFKHKKCNGSTIFIIEKSLILLARVISCTTTTWLLVLSTSFNSSTYMNKQREIQM